VTRPWEEVVLAGAGLRVVVLPGKGADLVSVVDLASGAELLARLRPVPADDGTMRAVGASFDDWYAGGWQTILPNGDEACVVDGVAHPFHGEAWARSWAVLDRSPRSVTLRVDLETLPLTVTKTITVEEVEPVLTIAESVTNAGSTPVRMLWGQHPAFGPPLVGAGARIVLPPCTVESVAVDSRSRLLPSSALAWPIVPGVDGEPVDVSVVRGPEARAHDLCLASGFVEGWYAVRNEAAGLGVRLEFDPTLFRRLWIWQLYGAADDAPFTSGYCLAVEPFTGPPSLAAAVAAGEALVLAPQETRRTSLKLRVDSS
jgi:galactose mutarotase-like enzyme